MKHGMQIRFSNDLPLAKRLHKDKGTWLSRHRTDVAGRRKRLVRVLVLRTRCRFGRDFENKDRAAENEDADD